MYVLYNVIYNTENSNWPDCLAIRERVNKLQFPHLMEYHTANKIIL